ncbi:CHAT domain-containing protein [Actinoplanes siamensis]|uniref:CHAT domain-containing protein n=1 Tax=Actinoplanes siamensis TaxID=1223317 RepID=A0A919TK59_9ACTN|nr:CHAT domain-containing protein [Actinoplanes siamensis]GIF05018.1 hypothetical protein Asi03nite_25560 [Actinoplanes siamensis]
MSHDIARTTERYARERGIRMLVITLGPAEVMPVAALPGPPGAEILDAGSEELLAGLTRWAADPAIAECLRDVTGTALEQGRDKRRRGDLSGSFRAGRLGLFTAAVLADAGGVVSATTNIWTLREVVREIVDRVREDTPVGDVADGIPADAAAVCPLVAAIAGRVPPPESPPLLHAWQRLARLSGDHRQRRAVQDRLRTTCAEYGAWEILIQAAAGEVGQMDFVDVLVSSGRIARSAAGEGNDAHDAMTVYAEARRHLPAVVADPAAAERVFADLALATSNLVFNRQRATTAAGPLAHQLSYLVSEHLHLVGRDLVLVLRKLGADARALGAFESIVGGSLSSWMSRNHPMTRLDMTTVMRLGGVLQSTPTIDASGIGDLVTACGPLLYLMRQPDGVAAWLVRPDGEILAGTAGGPDPALAALGTALPYLSGGPGELARQISGSPQSPEPDADLDEALSAGYAALIPPEIDDVLGGLDRLVVIPDPWLEPLPLAALRTPRGRYLLEELQVSVAPSATALELLVGSLKRRPPETGSLVLGRSRFDETVQWNTWAGPVPVRPAPLPGAGTEARQVADLLGVEPFLDEAATRSVLRGTPQKRDVVHIATHGYYDQGSPLSSFLALADGPLSADEIYRYDAGTRARLVVLSACQTALGDDHPDSTIGLANAFLVAGANTVVSSLWRIPDELTAPLMRRFHELVQDGRPPGAALRTAQLEMLDDPETADPRVWAAFRVAGVA